MQFYLLSVLLLAGGTEEDKVFPAVNYPSRVGLGIHIFSSRHGFTERFGESSHSILPVPSQAAQSPSPNMSTVWTQQQTELLEPIMSLGSGAAVHQQNASPLLQVVSLVPLHYKPRLSKGPSPWDLGSSQS